MAQVTPPTPAKVKALRPSADVPVLYGTLLVLEVQRGGGRGQREILERSQGEKYLRVSHAVGRFSEDQPVFTNTALTLDVLVQLCLRGLPG